MNDWMNCHKKSNVSSAQWINGAILVYEWINLLIFILKDNGQKDDKET
jgi:hypothetical protein